MHDVGGEGPYLLIDRTDGQQTRIDAQDDIFGPNGEGGRQRLELHQVPEVLARGDGWVDHPTECRFEPEEEWQQPTDWEPALHRVYARGVVSVMLVRDPPARALW